MKVLVFAPHADDTELGCGGTIAALVDAGWTVQILIACMSAYKVRHSEKVVTVDQRLKEAKAGAHILGASLWGVLDAPENELHTFDRSRLVRYLEQALDDVKPDVLFVCLKSFNQDHTALWDATMAALRPNGAGWHPPTVLAYEYPMSCWSETGVEGTFGRRYSPITAKHLVQKVAALNQHESQMFGRQNTITGEAGVKTLAHMRGLECGAEAAEMFHVLKEVRHANAF
jgi:LmbE family N-acetylglucosaminyl deacetylase